MSKEKLLKGELRSVSNSDYKLIQQIRNLREKGFSDEDILQLDRNKEISNEEKQRGRQIAIEINKRRIRQLIRLIEHKRVQVKDKTSLEMNGDYKDGLKPIFMIENEIEDIEANIEQLKEVNKSTQEEYDKCPVDQKVKEKEEDK